MAEEKVALELIQHHVIADTIAHETVRLVRERVYRQEVLQKLVLVKTKLGGGGGSEKTAQVALNML